MATSIGETRDARRHVRSSHDSVTDSRSSAQRDRDRILYSSAFRRLSGITQVASPGEFYPVHNRLTHSLKVAQVGRSLALHLLRDSKNRDLAPHIGGLDPDVVEAAGLAHDLGHPPFGHIAETELDQLLVEDSYGGSVLEGYDGNAQTFRIVTRLAVRYRHSPGLNLTRATLRAILKYPWKRALEGKRHDKWGVFASESADFEWCCQDSPLGMNERSLEAQLMDWADDIAYAVHDMEDFFRAGLIPLDRLATDSLERSRFLQEVAIRGQLDAAEQDQAEQAMNRTGIVEIGLPGPFYGSQIDRSALRGFTSSLIGKYVGGSVNLVKANSDSVKLAIDPDHAAEVKILKALTWHYVIESPSLQALRFGQRSLIRSLFEIFCTAAHDGDGSIFPRYFRDELDRDSGDGRTAKRLVADLISGMSEAQAIAVHQRLTGQALGSALDMYLQ
jgi:dGTPase